MAKYNPCFKAESLGFWPQNGSQIQPRGPQNRPILAPFWAQNRAQNPRLSALKQGFLLAVGAQAQGTLFWASPGAGILGSGVPRPWDPGILGSGTSGLVARLV